ncbi:thioredoxin family protein [Neobacillus sp. YIM B02564]|uniref:Thioredoxin family protein n=1 Tax=Neobacillus paridis TaxID=2803862 RepID=A0ABS1TIG0_9BACI|nr:thioredoxin family protein [Neobacillus paridis]MBL4951111.1 thioredoxin family protein [Neobacillus paridis]
MSKQILKFSRVGCTPCKIMTNFLNEQGVEYKELDVEDDAQLAVQYGISGVPTLLLVDENGDVLDRVVGFNPSAIEKLLSN